MYAHLLCGNREIFVPPWETVPRAASGRPEAVADDERGEEVRLIDSTCEAGEQSGAIRRGAGGGRRWDQEECGTAKHGPNTESGSRDTSAGPHIRGFFDAMAHSWIIRFLEHRIADKRILRLIAKWLKVGIVEDGRRTRGVCGAPQGAVISPILANVYLHYVFDLWVHRWRLTKASGDMIVIRYADDTIVGLQHEHEARAFLDDLKERMRKFELALHPDKTRLIRFGRHAVKQRAKLGEGKPETFDFLGFTHFCTRSRKWGIFVIGRKTIKKRMRAKMQAIKIELRRIMHDPIAKTGAWVKQMLKGHLNYFAVSGNHPSLWWFFNKVKRLWLASLKRRSQTARLSWERFIRLVARFFPPIRTLHPLPCHRFDARTRGRSPVR